MKKKVVLAYSGGLDTSYCAKYLSAEKNLEVYAVIVNTGGFSESELRQIEKKAKLLGAASFSAIDAMQSFYDHCIRYLIFGNVLRNQTYPLSVSAERAFQAIEIIKYAQEINAQYVAHGSTGAGNDQVRFDLIFQVLAPEIEIITPIRDLGLSRDEELQYLKRHGVDLSWEKAKYSINKGIWGTSVGGQETLTSRKSLPEEAYPSPLEKESESRVQLDFIKGELVGLNGQTYLSPVEAIIDLQKLCNPYAIGRDIHVGDTIIGIKGRVGFEAAAPLLIIKAHHLLEKHVLSKWQQYWKEQLANWYGMLLHEGQYLEPVMRDIEQFLAHSQERVQGSVFATLSPRRFELEGIQSPYDLMSSTFGQYGEKNTMWNAEEAKGFIKILGTPLKIWASFDHENQSND